MNEGLIVQSCHNHIKSRQTQAVDNISTVSSSALGNNATITRRGPIVQVGRIDESGIRAAGLTYHMLWPYDARPWQRQWSDTSQVPSVRTNCNGQATSHSWPGLDR